MFQSLIVDAEVPGNILHSANQCDIAGKNSRYDVCDSSGVILPVYPDLRIADLSCGTRNTAFCRL